MGAGCRIKCTKCGELIQSTFRHDFVRCSCGATFVDGGSDYLRCGGSAEFNDNKDIVIYDDDGVVVIYDE